MRMILIPAALLIAAAPGFAGAPKDDIPAATPTGKALDCVSQHTIRETRVRSDKVIDFIASGGKVYRNELPYSCPGLAVQGKFLHKTSTDDYCSVDTITVLEDPGLSRGATCGLGKFQPVTLDKTH